MKITSFTMRHLQNKPLTFRIYLMKVLGFIRPSTRRLTEWKAGDYYHFETVQAILSINELGRDFALRNVYAKFR